VQTSAVARKLQHHRAAETKPDGGHSVDVDLRQRGERRQRGAATCAKCFRLAAEVADQLCNFLQITRLSAVAEHVGGERHVAQLRQHARTPHRKIFEAQSLVKYQHARPPLGCFLIEGEIAAQIDGSLAVIDVVRLHRRIAPLTYRNSRAGTSHRFDICTRRIRNTRGDHICLNPAARNSGTSWPPASKGGREQIQNRLFDRGTIVRYRAEL
jgi:hypothetical protein